MTKNLRRLGLILFLIVVLFVLFVLNQNQKEMEKLTSSDAQMEVRL